MTAAHRYAYKVHISRISYIIGPLPINDGLSGQAHLAYFSFLAARPMPAHRFGAL
jgi:hypothetical protein